MKVHNIIFSLKRSDRIARHLVFWLVVAVLYFLQSIIPGRDVFHTAFISLICFIPASILATYTNLYWNFPKTLRQGKYFRFILFYLLTGLVCFGVNLFATAAFFNLATSYASLHTDREIGGLAFVNTSHAMVISALALGIKFATNWYLQQQENAQLNRQKILTELQLEKARMYPRFLFPSLHRLSEGIVSDSAGAASQILRISDLLSFILYDSKEKWIPLEDELQMTETRIAMESANRSGQLDFEFAVAGDAGSKEIRPMTLFPIVEECINITENSISTRTRIRIQFEIKPERVEVSIRLKDKEIAQFARGEAFQLFEKKLKRFELFQPAGSGLRIKRQKDELLYQLDVPVKIMMENHNQQA